MTLFSLSPGSKFNRTEIQQKTKLNNLVLDKALQRLVSSSILQKNKRLYSFNFEDENAKLILNMVKKQYLQLKELPLAVYYQICDFVEAVSVFKNLEVILFGSYAKLIYKDKSDIDLAVVYSGKLDNKRINHLTGKISQSYGKLMEIHYFEKNRFYKNKKDPLVKGILRDGIRLIS